MRAVELGGHGDETTADRTAYDLAFRDRRRSLVVGIQASGWNRGTLESVLRIAAGLRRRCHGARLWCVESRGAPTSSGRQGRTRRRTFVTSSASLFPVEPNARWIADRICS